jgi:hypothetical protein
MQPSRSGILVVTALLAGPATLAGQMCFRANPAPRCHSFWITEAGVGARLDPHPANTDDGASLTLELGHMVNSGRRSALGAAIFLQVAEPISGFGLRPRYRHWLSRKVSIDIGPGIEYRSNEARFLPSGQLALNLGSGFAVTGDVHLIRSLSGSRQLGWYGGGRLGGGLGLAGILGMVALGALVAATWN